VPLGGLTHAKPIYYNPKTLQEEDIDKHRHMQLWRGTRVRQISRLASYWPYHVRQVAAVLALVPQRCSNALGRTRRFDHSKHQPVASQVSVGCYHSSQVAGDAIWGMPTATSLRNEPFFSTVVS